MFHKYWSSRYAITKDAKKKHSGQALLLILIMR